MASAVFNDSKKTPTTGDSLGLQIADAAKLDAADVVKTLRTDPINGLDAKIADERLQFAGANRMSSIKGRTVANLLIDQFKSSVVVLLLVAAVISALSHEQIQMLGILAAVVINAAIGFATEYKALVSLRSLEELSGPLARVRRGGIDQEVAASNLVAGDLVILDAGCRVPADLKLLQAPGLGVDESILSGESVPAYKTAMQTADTTPQATVLYQGTLVVSGRARGVVVATANETRLGKLGKEIAEITATATPLEKNLDHMGNVLSVMTLIICAVLFIVGYLQQRDIWQMLQISISLAVAAIPEGLPVVATLALAVGTQRMVRLNALVRKLSAVETLGCTQIICTDKTGTLTQNAMSVSDIAIDKRIINVTGTGYAPIGSLQETGTTVSANTDPMLQMMLTAAALCNDARVENHEGSCEWHVHGDPTEGALITAAAKAGLSHKELKQKYPRLNELPFDLERKRMTTIHDLGEEGMTAFVKGSPEVMLRLSSRYLSQHGVKQIDSETRKWFSAMNSSLSAEGKRTLGIAMREVASHQTISSATTECDLIFLGLIAMRDQLKDGVKEAVRECQNAGIRVMMLTGDQPATALAIAKDLGIEGAASNKVVSGDEFSEMSDAQKSEALKNLCILARVKPEDKLSIVRMLQSDSQVVAMTGDGVNDAPALRQADIGVAMGRSGTAMARESSDMVITDDNFNTIVHAIEQGRNIYNNIARAIAYLLTASLTSVFAVTFAVLGGNELLLSPLQILWLNLIMHVFPGLGIVLQKGSPDIMSETPRKQSDKLLGRYQIIQIAVRSCILSLCAIGASSLYQGSPAHEKEGTILFATLSLGLLLQAWSWLTAGKPGFRQKSPGFNWSMWINTGIGVALLAVAIYLPPLQSVLETKVLSLHDALTVSTFALVSYGLSIVVGLRRSQP